ncbi:MAG: ISL3 family transposase [Ileibacterium sp.]|nr:ISL3 family transposase [Ileibacterium sp.]
MANNIPENSAQGAVIDLFGLDSRSVQSISSEFHNNTHYVHITLVPDYPPCPECHSENPIVKSYIPKRIKHSVITEAGCVLLYNARRYKCPICGRTYYEPNPFAFKFKRISHRTILNVLELLRSPSVTFKMAADQNGISPTTAQSIFDQYIDYPKPEHLPKILLVDEVYAFKSEDSKYVCVLLDYEKMEPLDLLPNRRKETLLDYFYSFPREERKKVRYFASDMYETYRSVARECFPNAVIGCDRFHVLQEFTRRMTEVRIRVMKGYDKKSEGYYLLKHQYELLNIRPDATFRKKSEGKESPKELVFDPCGKRQYNNFYKRKMNKFELLRNLRSLSWEIEKAYDFKNELSDFYRNETLETAEKKLNEIIRELEKSRIPEMEKFAGTLRSWSREIINSFHIVKKDYRVNGKTGEVYEVEHHLTSSLAENRNKILKQLKICANGYANWERMRNRGLYVMDKNPVIRAEPKKEKRRK